MLKCAVVGASGYIGGELVRLLLAHPHVKLTAITANEAAGKPLVEEHPNLRGVDMTFGKLTEVGDAEVLFLAVPSGESMKLVPQLPANRKIIDTTPDFRLQDKATFEQYYKTTWPGAWTYGLPELFRARIREAMQVAAPGCFATAAILSAWPLVSEGLAESIVITAVTGSSGSGAKPKDKAHHPFRNDSYFAYEIFHHRHVPEIRQALGWNGDFIFQPHSGPFVRGIFATTVVTLKSDADVKAVFKKYYGAEKFVRLVDGSPNVKWVQGTNFADIGVEQNGKTAIVLTAIDNLLKGGASQAVQCFNVMHGFEEDAGLKYFGGNP